jgi:hypothetical protein
VSKSSYFIALSMPLGCSSSAIGALVATPTPPLPLGHPGLEPDPRSGQGAALHRSQRLLTLPCHNRLPPTVVTRNTMSPEY